jgi:hypothetical protein
MYTCIKESKKQILIKFPSRQRPQKMLDTFSKYIDMATSPEKISFLVSLDEDDSTVTSQLLETLMSKHKQCKIIIGKSAGKIGAVNRDMEHAPVFDILLLASDDMIPVQKGYDEMIRNKMESHYPDNDGVLFFNDGNQGDKLNTICILGKKYYDRFGYIYHPSYKSLWCDNEFTEVAYSLGKQTYFSDVIIQHEHPEWMNGKSDPLYEKNQTYNDRDQQNYYQRKEKGFPLSIIK